MPCTNLPEPSGKYRMSETLELSGKLNSKHRLHKSKAQDRESKAHSPPFTLPGIRHRPARPLRSSMTIHRSPETLLVPPCLPADPVCQWDEPRCGLCAWQWGREPFE